MATIFGTNTDNTLIVGGDDLRGLGGNDTYIITNSLANNPANANRTIVITDTEGANRLQFADGLQISNVQFLGGNAIQVTLTNNLRIQVVGANAFTFDIGGNSVADDNTGLIGRSFTQLAADLGVNLVNGAGTTAAPVTIQPGAAPLAPPAPPVQPYTVTANAPSIVEGNAGNSTLSFQLTLDRPATETVTLNVATNGGTATAGADYIPLANTVTFAVGQTTAFVNVTVVGDTTNELNETIQLVVTGAQITAPVNAIGTITNDDADPAVAPQSFTLQPGIDSFVGAGGNDTFTANAGTFQAGDTLTGGDGVDRLIANDRVTDQAFTNVTSVETVELTSVNPPGTVAMTNPAPDTIGIFAANAGVQTVRMTVQSEVNLAGFNRNLSVVGSIDADAAAINLTDAGVKTIDLGSNVPSVLDRAIINGAVNQVRVSFASGEVGNGSSNNTTAPTTTANQAYNNQAAGGLAVRLEEESATGFVTGEAGDNAASQTHRYEDEGILFTGATFDVRDVATLANRGNFQAVALGTNGADVINGTLLGLVGTDSIYINAGAGADTLTDTANNDFLVGNGDNDTINTTGGNDSVLGGQGADTITATTGDDSIDGGSEDDRVVIASADLNGNDTIIGGAGTADTLVVTTGDLVDAQLARVTTTEVLELNAAQNASLDVLAIAAGIRTVNATGNFVNTITLEQQDAAGQIAITVNGGDGADQVTVSNVVNNGGPNNPDLGSFNVAITGVETFTVDPAVLNGVTAVASGATAVTFSDGQGADNFTGGDGADTFNIGFAVAAVDTVAGGAGADTLNADDGTISASSIETISFQAGGAVTVNVTDDTAATVVMRDNAVINAGGGADTINLTSNGAQTINGGGGDDLITALGNLTNNVRINGGAGANRLSVSQAGLADAAFTNVSNVQTLVLQTTGAVGSSVTLDTNAFNAGITTVNGSQNLTPLATGASTNDTIAVQAGALNTTRTLTIDGGEITANNDTDTVNVAGAGNVVLNVTNVETVNGSALTGALTATATGAQAVLLNGGTGADSLTGGTGNDTLVGGDGRDTLIGGSGDDSYAMTVTQFNTDLDTITEVAAGGTDTLDLSSGASVSIVDVGFNARFTNIERVTFSTSAPGGAAEVFTATLGAFAAQTGLRTFEAGNAGADLNLTFTNQFTGNITVRGGDQADVVDAGAIDGTVTYVDGLAGSMGDTVTTGAMADTVTLVDGNNMVVTNAGTDTVSLGNGTDNVNTGTGNDTVNGGANVTDADVLAGGADTDMLNLQGTTVLGLTSQVSGFETINALSSNVLPNGTFNYSLTLDNDNAPSAGNNLTINGTTLRSAERLNVDASAATTFGLIANGGAAADILIGSQAIDSLTGGEGSDMLIGGIGNDLINLAETTRVRDTVVLRGTVANLGRDEISGFDRTAALVDQDQIALDASLFTSAFSYADVAQGGSLAANNVINITTSVVGGADTGVKVASFLQTNNFGPSLAGDAKTLFLTDGTDTYVWAYVSDGLANVNATEFTNIAVLRGVVGVTNNNVIPDQPNGPFTTLNDARSFTANDLTNIAANRNGLDGNDTLTISTAGNVIGQLTNIETINLNAGGNLIAVQGPVAVIGNAGVDQITVTGSGTVTGNGGDDTFAATGGSTLTITDLSGSDNLQAQGGANTVTATVTAAYTAGANTLNHAATGAVSITTSGFSVDMTGASDTSSFGYRVTNTGAGTTLTGDGNNDTLVGGSGNDALVGANGNDSLDGGLGNDMLTGGNGDDIHVIDGTDVVTDLSGNDFVRVLATGTLNGTVTGLWGSFGSQNNGIANIFANGFGVNLSTATGANGFNLMNQTAGGVVSGVGVNLTGSGQNDTLVGGDGMDTLIGNGGNDTMTGGMGNDTFGVVGTDVITDLSGNDNVIIDATGVLNATVTANWTVTNASNNNGTANITTAGFDVDLSLDSTGSTRGYRVTNTNGAMPTNLFGSNFAGTAGNGDTLIGAGGVDIISGLAGDDSLVGNGGADELSGGDGNDTIDGGAGADLITGGLGNDSLTGGADLDTFVVDAGTDTITDLSGALEVLQVSVGATANATVTASYTAGATSVNNGTANLSTNGFSVSMINAQAGNGFTITNVGTGAVLTGSNNADTINGGSGVDIITAGGGDDVLSGNGGDDVLSNNLGNDTISGGAGADSTNLALADTASTSERVRYDTLGDISAAGGATNVDVVTGFDANANGNGNDLIVFGGALRTALDDNASGSLNAGATNGLDGGNDVIGIANSEFTVLLDAEVEIGVSAFTEAGLVSLLGELNEEIDFSGIATGQEHLFVVNVSATQAGLVYYEAANGGDDVITAAELRIVGIVNHNDNDNAGNLVAADIGLI